MGLDITAFSRLRHIGPCALDREDCYDSGHVKAYAYASHPDSFDGLAGADHIFQFIHSPAKFIGGHCYAPTDETQTYHFYAGSYPAYGNYRAYLSDVFLGNSPSMAISTYGPDPFWQNIEDYKEQPFYELVNFADNDGCIGPDAADRLYHDAMTGRPLWADHVADDTFNTYMRLYDEWIRAFQLASRDGLVKFH